MRFWTKVWIAVVVVCIVASIYEAPNAAQLWRFIRLMKSSRQTGSGKLDIPKIVTDKLVAADPEAGDMLRYCLQYYNKDVNMEGLAVLAAKWPDNEFLLSELAERLATEGVVDTRAALTLVDRLIHLNSDNAHYRYMKGWILLTDPNRPDSLEKALEQFESGHNLPEFYLLYSKYKHRLDQLYARVTIPWERPRFSLFYANLARYLRHRLSDDTIHDLTNSVAKIADRVIENAYDEETLLAGVVLLRAAETIRLRELDLSQEELQQSRLQMAQTLALSGVCTKIMLSDTLPILDIVLVGLLSPILLMFLGCSVLDTVFKFARIRLSRREPKVWESIKWWLIVDSFLVLVLVTLVLAAIFKKLPKSPAGLAFLTMICILWNAAGLSGIHPVNLARLRWPRLWIRLLCGSMWFKGAVIWTAGSFSIFSLNWALYGLILVGWSVFCLFVWLEITYQPGMFASKHCHIVTMVMYWAVVLMTLHIFGFLDAQISHEYADPLSSYRPLPEATQETYSRLFRSYNLLKLTDL